MPTHHPPEPFPAGALPDLGCLCATVRRTARLVSQFYGDHLREHGTEPAQMSLLMTLHHLPGKSQVALTRILGLDKTSLSRNLKLLKQKGIVETRRVAGQREPGFFLTPAGESRLKAAKPAWSRAQSQLRAAMSSEEWEAMTTTFRTLTRVANSFHGHTQPPGSAPSHLDSGARSTP